VAIKLPSNLHRNRFGILYFRLTIPKDIQSYFATKVIYRSLHTSSLRLATDSVRSMAINTKYLFKELRNQHMSEPKKTSLECCAPNGLNSRVGLSSQIVQTKTNSSRLRYYVLSFPKRHFYETFQNHVGKLGCSTVT
jgi:hypothetical protein